MAGGMGGTCNTMEASGKCIRNYCRRNEKVETHWPTEAASVRMGRSSELVREVSLQGAVRLQSALQRDVSLSGAVRLQSD
jgi:hypothetical protein